MAPVHLCNLVWAPVALGITADVPIAVWEGVATQSTLKMPEMPSQAVTNLLWAFAKAGIRQVQSQTGRAILQQLLAMRLDLHPTISQCNH